MKEQWKALSARFAVLNQREKHLVSGAILVAILFGGYSILIAPALTRKANAEKQIAQYQADINNLGAQATALRFRLDNPDAASRAGIAEKRKLLADLDRQLNGFGKQLVVPEKMGLLLQSLLTGHRGLELVSLRTLAPQPIIASQTDKAETKSGEHSVSESTVTVNAGNIYKHGIEIKVAGSYQDLLAYVNEIESSPQHLLMGRINLSATKYPRVELTLTVYSLSLDRTWLVV